jgi:hypothetical protein
MQKRGFVNKKYWRMHAHIGAKRQNNERKGLIFQPVYDNVRTSKMSKVDSRKYLRP